MPLSAPVKPLFVLFVVALVVEIFLLPGVGVETRQASQFASWVNAIFLGLLVVAFVLIVAALVMAWSRPRLTAYLAYLFGFIVVTLAILDISQIGGPAPPTGVSILEIIKLVNVIFLFRFSGRLLRRPTTQSTKGISG